MDTPQGKRKIPKAELRHLSDGGNYYVRLIRLYEPEPFIVFEGITPLIVKCEGSGKVRLITTGQIDWAEGSEQDAEDSGSIVVEDYLMEVFEPETGQV